MSTDEAGFEVLKGSEDSKVSSQLYNEKAFVISKGFVKTALQRSPKGFADIVGWLYFHQSGPGLLNQIIEKSSALSGESSVADTPSQLEIYSLGPHGKLSAGALVLLRRNLEWLIEYRREIRTTS